MKSIITNLFILLCVYGGVQNAYSQTATQRRLLTKDYDKVALRKLQQQLNAEFTTNYNRALILAKQNNQPINYVKADGSEAKLHGVDDFGNLLYYSVDNADSAITSRANELYPGGSLGLDLTGLNMFAFVWDSHLAFDKHLDLKNRVFNLDGSTVGYGVGVTNGDHGTHVTGTIISSGANSGSGKMGRGIAYEATVFNNDWTNDTGEMISATVDYGALLSNHSYGIVSQTAPSFLYLYGAYIGDSRDFDNIAFNAPYFQPVVAAGNDRGAGFNPDKNGYDLLTGKSVAKNAIVVAAVESVPSYTSASSVLITDFTSFGPTDDNRIKPDISDKGKGVYSTTNTSTTAYVSKQGTSMAAPGVTGTLLLLQQHFSNVYPDNSFPEYLYGPFMKAATLKGLMCHTADEAGTYEGPDSKFGWGLINAQKAAQVITNSATAQSVLAELSLSQGQTYTKNISVSGGEPLMATIAWTDRAGAVSTGVVDMSKPVLVNDLDIRITKVGGDTSFPWKLDDISKGYDVPAIKGDNIVDNIEKVQIDNPSGDYTITVTHKKTLVGGSQDFSLIVTGSGVNLATNATTFKTFNVWPNPINDVLNVAIESQSNEDVFVTVYDILGKRVINQKLNFSNDFFNGSLNVNGLNPGIYLVKVIQGDKESVRKIVKK